MELNKEDAIKISESYSLGSFESVKPLKGGLSNYNFELITDKGSFIVRFPSKSDDNELVRIDTQLKAINFLSNNDFGYELTIPIKNDDGEYLGRINDNRFWIYKKIGGDTYEDPGKVDIKELARMIAKYHLIMDQMPMEGIESTFYDYEFIGEGLKKIEELINSKEDKDGIDLFIEENMSNLKEGFKRIKKINFGSHFIIAHSDWCVFNLIFDKDKIKGLIDFDMYQVAPYIQDIAIAIKEQCFDDDWAWDKEKADIFFKEYEKIRYIDKFDKYHIKDLIIRDSLGGVVNFYLGKKKVDFKKRLFMIKWFIIPLNNLLEDIKRRDYY